MSPRGRGRVRRGAARAAAWVTAAALCAVAAIATAAPFETFEPFERSAPSAHGRTPLGLLPLAAPPQAQVQLGRQLFFDRRLSVNGSLSCAMCHVPEQGFTSNEVRTSVGMAGVSLRRNAPTLLNVAHQALLFHDGRVAGGVAGLQAQALMPLLHPDEMANRDLPALLARLAAIPDYRRAFARSFGTSRPDAAHLAAALAAYQSTLLAADAPFDRWHFGGETGAIDADARRGFGVFIAQGCGRCHAIGAQAALFTDHAFHNTGIAFRSQQRRLQPTTVALAPGLQAHLSPAELARVGEPAAPEHGRFEVSRRPADLRAMRTPTLRNVALTAPYMHDGSLATLEEVIDHYADGGARDDPALDPLLRPLQLTTDDRRALLAFLRSLSSPRLPLRH